MNEIAASGSDARESGLGVWLRKRGGAIVAFIETDRITATICTNRLVHG